MIEYKISGDDDGCRVDRIVKRLCNGIGYARLQKIFRVGKIKVNSKKVAPDLRVQVGDVVSIYEVTRSEDQPKTEEFNENQRQSLQASLNKMIIFENDNLLAINKPAGLSVQLGSKLNFCVETLLKAKYEKFFLVHRLDKDTTGVLLVAKTQKSARELTKLFREDQIRKTYWALVDGKINKPETISNYLAKSFVSGEEIMAVASEGQKAITKYSPLQRVGYFTLLELKPETGRKHQLRVHCATSLNAPILGDRKYNKNCLHKNLFLHAKQIEIPSLKLTITAPLPEHFEEMLAKHPG